MFLTVGEESYRNCQRGKDEKYLTSLFFIKILFLSNLYSQHGAQTYNPDIKNCALSTEPVRHPNTWEFFILFGNIFPNVGGKKRMVGIDQCFLNSLILKITWGFCLKFKTQELLFPPKVFCICPSGPENVHFPTSNTFSRGWIKLSLRFLVPRSTGGQN